MADGLLADILARDTHLNTGVLSTKYLLPVLTRFGHGDVALALAQQRTYPSWGHWLEHGATTLWEHWHEDSRSLDHLFLGTVDEWFYATIAGISRDDVAWRRIRFEPRVLGALERADAVVTTPLGRAAISWDTHNTDATVRIEVPYRSQGVVILPPERKPRTGVCPLRPTERPPDFTSGTAGTTSAAQRARVEPHRQIHSGARGWRDAWRG